MNPFFFGSAQRRLFGVYTPARAGSARQRAIVLCHPWGQEYLHAHRAMRQLAGMLADAGFHVLRFDYFGTGDSAGEMTDGNLGGWSRDIEMAIEELKDSAGVARVTLLGLRLGATLAAIVAGRRRNDIDALVLWDPIVSGDKYLMELQEEEFQRSGLPAVVRPENAGGGHEVLGFPLTAAISGEIQSTNLLVTVPVLPARTLIITSVLPAESEFLSALALHPAGPLTIEPIEDQKAWLEDRTRAVPVKVLRRIPDWLG
jgi:uncharacterized protein